MKFIHESHLHPRRTDIVISSTSHPNTFFDVSEPRGIFRNHHVLSFWILSPQVAAPTSNSIFSFFDLTAFLSFLVLFLKYFQMMESKFKFLFVRACINVFDKYLITVNYIIRQYSFTYLRKTERTHENFNGMTGKREEAQLRDKELMHIWCFARTHTETHLQGSNDRRQWFDERHDPQSSSHLSIIPSWLVNMIN